MSEIGPLAGVRVLDLSRFPPGAYCTVLLGDLGAEVCRVDAPGVNPARFGVGTGLSRGKRSVAVDLRNPRGMEVVRKLAGWADVLVENNRPGDLEQRGFGYPQAAVTYPGLIWCSITGFGQDGPYSQWAGHDVTYTGHAGVLAALNPELPWVPKAMVAVPAGAMMAATGIAAALVDRGRTGRGCHLDISLAEAATWMLSGNDSEFSTAPIGVPTSASRRLYQCGDGRYVSVAADEPRIWASLCEALGLPDLAAGGPPRGDSQEASERIAAVFATRPAAEWVRQLGPRGAAVAGVNRGADLIEDPHVRARGSLVSVSGATVPANPVRISGPEGARWASRTSAPPEPGANTDQMLAAAGYTPDDIEDLKKSGAVTE